MAKNFDTGRVQNRLINRLERQERQKSYERERFLRFKLTEIHNRLSQTLLMENIIETDKPAAIAESLLKGLKKAMRSSEFDFKFFVAPIRDLISRPNPYALYMTQYVMEVLINDPNVIEIYGTDQEIYRVINKIFSEISIKFERVEEEIVAQLARDKSLVQGSRDYEIRMDQLMRQKMGDPQQ